MPSNEYDLFDISYILDSVDAFTESVEQHFESVGRSLKDTFRDSGWIPDSIKPVPPPPPPRRLAKVPLTYIGATRNWISEHRAVTAGVLAFVGTGAFLIWRRRRSDRAKRRAKRAKNGSRSEVVVLAGSPHLPLTRSISSELERRGFVVYIVIGSFAEEQVMRSMSKSDIRPLNIDIASVRACGPSTMTPLANHDQKPSSTQQSLREFTIQLQTPQKPIPKAPTHTLNLAALVLLPGSTLPAKSITSTSSSRWSETLNTRLLAPITVLHAFLPLLAAQKSSLLFLSPSILPSLAAPLHAAENTIFGGFQQYVSTLRKEVQSLDINIVQLQLGDFDNGLAIDHEEQQVALNQHLAIAEATRQRLESKGTVEGVA